MRFPSFIRLPRHQKFQYEPRYYDPIKEDIERRISLAKKQHSVESNADAKERISAHWKRNERSARKASVLQLVILAVLVSTVVAYFYLGNTGLYIMIGIFIFAYCIYRFNMLRKAEKGR